MISVIVCSIDPGKFAAVSRNLADRLGGSACEIITPGVDALIRRHLETHDLVGCAGSDSAGVHNTRKTAVARNLDRAQLLQRCDTAIGPR